ncbi:MAG TPA: GWxTD domain-containing protein [Gemmatimonadales bacterium]|nr:GWxTD domain-containing protein [Gemmatimonadales bacterium]
MLALLLVALPLQGPGTVDPESLLAAGRLSEARRTAERLVARDPRDARARLQLARVWNAWPVIGRYRALEQFRAAERLAPDDLEPLRGQIEVGYRLGSDEGEAMARAALLKLLALRPDDSDAWARFTELYHSDDIRRRAERVLATHPDDLTALERRALIALALEEPARADSLAARVLARRGPHVPAWLVRAEAAFQLDRDAAGYKWYDSALAHADLDSASALWDNVRLIATPDEAARFDAAGPDDRRRFFHWFWGKRDPNLLTRQSERIAEHFRRLAYVRRRFQLLHPLSLYHRSASARALSAAGLRRIQHEFLQNEPALLPPDTPGARSIYSLAGLDARGLVWLRHGPPDVRLAKALDATRPRDLPGASSLDAEAWLYESADGPASVAFTRATASAGLQLGGDYIFTPTTRRQLQDTRRLLTTDRTTLPAPLAARVWTAFFRGRTPGRTDVYYRSAHDAAGLALWDESGVAAALTGGVGLLRISVPPGRYTLGMDVDSAGVLGRIRDAINVPHFARAAVPTVSSLVLAAADSSGDREATLAGMPADLVFRSGAPLAAYAEIYGLAADAHGVSRYVARYTFAAVQSRLARTLGGSHEVVFEFTREAPAQDLAVEQLVLEAGRVPPGRYRVTLGVTDAVRNVKAESVAVEITVR